MTKKTDREPKGERVPETRIRKPNAEGYMTVAEFRERIKRLVGLKPEGYYNAPVEQPPTLVTKADLAARRAERKGAK